MKVLFLALLMSLAQANPKLIDWSLLSQVDFEDRYSKEMEGWYIYPVFSEKLKALNGKPVTIKGYVIPLDVEGGKYALSAYPFSSCFFCGGAGPESVMTLKFKDKPRRYKTDEVIRFSGLLKLNDSNPDDFCYILEQCEPVTK